MIITIRNAFIHWFYTHIQKPLLFRQDPERVHDRFMKIGQLLGSHRFTQAFIHLFFSYKHSSLKQEIAGVEFDNPIGLAAGFDKDALLTDILPHVGFGFEEVGSITGEPCEGNPKPRLWRHPEKKSLRVYYGLKNEGCEKISRQLRRKRFSFPVGISIAKTNCAETTNTKAGIADYLKAHKKTVHIGDYTTINISCPNAFGGQPFTDKKSLNLLLKEITKVKTRKPLFVKLSPDLSKKQLDDILLLVNKYKIAGVVSTNLTKKHNKGKGGLSGKAVEKKTNIQIKYIFKKTKGKIIIIGCGGVFSAENAYKKIKAGASLIQMITGMIYEGPQVISEINRGLVQLLRKDGYSSISEAIGADHR